MAYAASHTPGIWDARSVRRPQPGRRLLALHSGRPTLRETGILTLLILLWTTGQHDMLPVTARDTSQQLDVPYETSQNGAAVHEDPPTPGATKEQINDHITQILSRVRRRHPIVAFAGWGVESDGSNPPRPGKHHEEKTGMPTSPTSVEGSFAESVENGPAELERPPRKSGDLLRQNERYEADENQGSFPPRGGKQIEGEEVTSEVADIPDDKAEAETRAALRSFKQIILQRRNQVGTSSDTLLSHVNSIDLQDRKGTAEYFKGSDTDALVGTFSTAPEVMRSTEQMGFTPSYNFIGDLFERPRHAEGPQSSSVASGEGSGGESSQRAGSDLVRPSATGHYAVTGKGTFFRKTRGRLGENAVELLQVRPVLKEEIVTSLRLAQAGDRTRGSQSHPEGAGGTEGKPPRRLAAGIDEIVHGHSPSDEHMSTDSNTPGSAFIGDPQFQDPSWYQDFQDFDMRSGSVSRSTDDVMEWADASTLQDFQDFDMRSESVSQNTDDVMEWVDASTLQDFQDFDMRSASVSQSTDDVMEWVDESTLEPAFHYPGRHRLADPKRGGAMRGLEDDMEEIITEYTHSEPSMAEEGDATAGEFAPTGYADREPDFEYNSWYDYLNSDFNAREQEPQGNGYMAYSHPQADPGLGLQFASEYSALDGEHDLHEGSDELWEGENLFEDASKTYPYAAESFSHVQRFGGHRDHSSEADSSELPSATPSLWPSPSNYYADDEAGSSDPESATPGSWSYPYRYYADDEAGSSNLESGTSDLWSSPSNYYADDEADSSALPSATPSLWPSASNYYADDEAGSSDPESATPGSWSYPYSYYADDEAGSSNLESRTSDLWSSPSNYYADDEADSSALPSATPSLWPSPSNYYADDEADSSDLESATPGSWSYPYSNYADDEAGSSNLESGTPGLSSSPFKYYADNQAAGSNSVSATPGLWPSSSNYHVGKPSGVFNHLDTETPSAISPSSVQYDSDSWKGSYEDPTENPFDNVFTPAFADYWSQPAESFYHA